MDPSELMLIKAREKVGCNPRAEFHQVDEPFLRIPYPESSFDAVISTYAYHHIPHRLRTDSVREMVRVLSNEISHTVYKLHGEDGHALLWEQQPPGARG